MIGMLPVTLLANPEGGPVSEEKKKPRKQSAKQRAASLKNLRKARAAKGGKTKPKKRATPKKKPGAARPKKKGTRTMAQSAKQRAASLRNLRKARAARKVGGHSRRRTTSRSAGSTRRRPRRNGPGESKTHVRRMVAFAEVASGALVGGVTAGGLEYLTAGTVMLATPGRRALMHGAIGTVVGVGGAVALPKAMGFFGGVAGSFFGLAAANGLKAVMSGSAATTPAAAAAPNAGVAAAAQQPAGLAAGTYMGADGVVYMSGIQRSLGPSRRGTGGMGSVVPMSAHDLRAVINRGPRPQNR